MQQKCVNLGLMEPTGSELVETSFVWDAKTENCMDKRQWKIKDINDVLF
jgi:hypothetical protein